MSESIEFTPREVRPPPADVLAYQGVPAGPAVSATVSAIVDEALGILAKTIRPRGICAVVTHEEFERIHTGEGQNAPDTPVGRIFPGADHLALFAATLGSEISGAIASCFERDDLALGAMLDAAASASADLMATRLEARFHERVRGPRRQQLDTATLSYSPGYCGWHVSGQKQLFARLRPERADMTLNAHCLMSPLKSVSGVLIEGPVEIHSFRDDFDFCDRCEERACRERIRTVYRRSKCEPDSA